MIGFAVIFGVHKSFTVVPAGSTWAIAKFYGNIKNGQAICIASSFTDYFDALQMPVLTASLEQSVVVVFQRLART